MNLNARVFRFRFAIGNFKTKDVHHVRTTFAESSCVFVIVVKCEDKLFGFVRGKKQRSIRSLRKQIGHRVKIEEVNKRKCDADVEAEYQAMIRNGGDEIVRIGAPLGRRKYGSRKKGTVAANSASLYVKKMCIDKNLMTISRLSQRHWETTAVRIPDANVVSREKQMDVGVPKIPESDVVSGENKIWFKKMILMRFREQMDPGVEPLS